VGRGEHATAGLQLAEQTKRVIELAVDEAKRLGHQYIGTEHLLLAMMRLPDSVGVAVLESLNIKSEIVRRRVLNMMRQDNPPEASLPQQRTNAPQPNREKSVLEQLGVDLTRDGPGRRSGYSGRPERDDRSLILARRT
jgi:ATP-dependent Clp protease ATP-binding subunit ClpC